MWEKDHATRQRRLSGLSNADMALLSLFFTEPRCSLSPLLYTLAQGITPNSTELIDTWDESSLLTPTYPSGSSKGRNVKTSKRGIVASL